MAKLLLVLSIQDSITTKSAQPCNNASAMTLVYVDSSGVDGSTNPKSFIYMAHLRIARHISPHDYIRPQDKRLLYI
jgi:hypothetical protein